MKWPWLRKDPPPPAPPWLRQPAKSPAVTELERQTNETSARVERSTSDLMRLWAELERRNEVKP